MVMMYHEVGLVRVADQAEQSPVQPGSQRSSYEPESSGYVAMQETPSPVQPAASGGVEENYEPVLYSQTRWVLQADSNEYMHRNATKRDGPWPSSVLCRAVPSHATRAGSWPHTRVQARCAARLIRGGTLNAGAAVFYGPGEHGGCRHRPCRRSRACTRRRSPRTVRPPGAAAGTEKHQKKKSGPAGSSRVGVGRLSAAVSASVVLAGQVERREEPLSLRSWAAGKEGRRRRPGKDRTEYRRIMETRFWDSSGCAGVGSRRGRCSASLAVLLRSAAAACSS